MLSVGIIGVLLIWAACFIGGVIFFFVVLRQRIKEKKVEEKIHKKYKDY